MTGDINQWSLDEMIHFADRYMPGSTVFSWANKSSVLSICLMANGDSLIDWPDEGRGVQKELLVKMLKFADRFLPDDAYAFDEEVTERFKVHGQLQIMSHEYISGFTDHQKFSGIFGEPASYPGYPSENGNGSLIDSNYVMAINNACYDKAAAWQFISSLLTEEYQWSRASISDFPIRKSVLAQKIESEMKAYYETDENGIQKEAKRWTTSVGSEKIDIYAAREEDIQAILAVINGADKIRVWNAQVSSIVYEEAGAFFSGSKSAEEAADIMENRIRIYMDELK
jgi:ABC-type glycerol-3-phosphate transport system substrate-binding protein